MTPDAPTLLLEDLAWLRSLGRQLARDSHLADDAAQETWLAARRAVTGADRDGRDDGGEDGEAQADARRPRAWLAAILRNWLRQHHRGERARRLRQQRNARPEAAPGTAELVQRAELQQQLVDCVLRLPEIYRDAILLRFFDDLPPRAIAERFRIPVDTVNSRLQRALQLLRSELDARRGGRAAWVALLAPAARFPLVATEAAAAEVAAAEAAAADVAIAQAAAGAATANAAAPPTAAGASPAATPLTAASWSASLLTSLEILAMNAKLKLALAAVVVAGLVPFVWPTGPDASQTRPDADPVATRGARAGGGSGGGGGSGSSLTTAAPERRPAPRVDTAEAAAGPATFTAEGRVLDATGTALPGVEIGVAGARNAAGATRSARATSNANGRFTLALPAGTCTLVATEERWVTVLAATWSPDARYEPVVVVAAAQRVAGRVVDTNGAPVAGALLAVQAPEGFEARFSLNLDRTQQQRWNVRSAADGAFRLPRVPRVDGATLLVLADAFRPAHVAMPPADDENVQIVLERFAYESGQLTGVVVDPEGVPVEGARVAMGVTSVATDAEGRFGLALRRAGWPSALVAAKAGYLPARCELPRSGGTRVDEWPERLVLRLGPKPLSIRGRVVDADGAPLEGALVWVTDPTPLGIVGVLPLQTEYVLAGGAVPPIAARMRVPFAEDPKVDEHVTEQNGVVSEPSAGWWFVRTDSRGEFEVGGLLPRSYTLRALDPKSAFDAESDATPAGRTVEIRIDREGVWPLVRGKVVSQRGEPLGGVDVQQLVSAFRTQARVPGGRFRGAAIHPGQRTVTAADGTFTLRDVGSRYTTLYASGDAILPHAVRAEDLGDPENVVLTVEARCHVEVALTDPAEADEVAARDAQGRGVDLAVLRANSTAFETELTLHDGKSGVFVLGERATELLLLRQGKVVRRVPIALQPGKVLRVQ